MVNDDATYRVSTMTIIYFLIYHFRVSQPRIIKRSLRVGCTLLIDIPKVIIDRNNEFSSSRISHNVSSMAKLSRRRPIKRRRASVTSVITSEPARSSTTGSSAVKQLTRVHRSRYVCGFMETRVTESRALSSRAAPNWHIAISRNRKSTISG